jgi:hypothetical protein
VFRVRLMMAVMAAFLAALRGVDSGDILILQ